MIWLSKNRIKSFSQSINMSRTRNTVFFSPCAGHIPAGHDEHSGVPGGVTALPPPAGLPPSSPAAHRTGTGWVPTTFPGFFRQGHIKNPPVSRNTVCTYLPAASIPVLWIHEILVRIRIRRRGSIPLTYGSVSGSGTWSCYFCQWPSRRQQKISSKFFAYYPFESTGTFTLFFKGKTSYEVTKQ